MSIYRRFEAREFPSLVTTNIADREALFASEAAARMFMQVLDEVRSEAGFHLLAFVVMPDHIHLIIIPSSSYRLGQIVQLIKGRFSRRYNEMTERSGRLWQSRYHERALRSEGELLPAIEYMHRNPVVAGLIKEASAFPWSSASGEYSTDLEMYLSQAKA
jgi:putative transposase